MRPTSARRCPCQLLQFFVGREVAEAEEADSQPWKDAEEVRGYGGQFNAFAHVGAYVPHVGTAGEKVLPDFTVKESWSVNKDRPGGHPLIEVLLGRVL